MELWKNSLKNQLIYELQGTEQFESNGMAMKVSEFSARNKEKMLEIVQKTKQMAFYFW
jgi:hypothetical protein